MEEINRGKEENITKNSSLIATNLGRKTKNARGSQNCNIFTFPILYYFFHHREKITEKSKWEMVPAEIPLTTQGSIMDLGCKQKGKWYMECSHLLGVYGQRICEDKHRQVEVQANKQKIFLLK